MNKDVIIALDFDTAKATFDFLDMFPEGKKPFVKIGMELFFSVGPDVVTKIKSMGHRVFLDLKLCDIPNTVLKSMRVLSRLGVDMTNLHAFGTIGMMKAAVEGLTRPDGTRPILLAVTQLTSTSEEVMRRELMIDAPMPDVVERYAQNALEAGLDGVVCSPVEASRVKASCGKGFITVTPGIRFQDSQADDQRRIMTPAKAREAGSDYIVVGRPITAALDPLAAYELCCKEFLKEV